MNKTASAVILMLIVTFMSGPASAQNEYFDDFQDTTLDYYDIHTERMEFFQEYKENRSELDLRRKNFESQRQEALQSYRDEWKNSFSRIEYDTGVSDF